MNALLALFFSYSLYSVVMIPLGLSTVFSDIDSLYGFSWYESILQLLQICGIIFAFRRRFAIVSSEGRPDTASTFNSKQSLFLFDGTRHSDGCLSLKDTLFRSGNLSVQRNNKLTLGLPKRKGTATSRNYRLLSIHIQKTMN